MSEEKSKSHILLVEDEPHLAFTLKLNLEAEFYNVSLAITGSEAIKLFQEHKFDLVLLDVMIPEPDGFSVAQTLRSKDKTVAIIMLTARTGDHDRIRGLAIGADDYIAKPFHLTELLLKVRRAIERVALIRTPTQMLPEPEIIEFGDFKLDPAALRLWNSKDSYNITALEADVLLEFIRNKNRVISREHLLETVWRMNQSTETRTVDNFVMRLRKYLEVNPAEPVMLESVRGRGYRLNIRK